MKLLIINSVIGYGSTGHIVMNIAREYEQNGYEVKIAYGRSFKVAPEMETDIDKYGVRIGSDINVYSHLLYSRLADRHGLASRAATRKFIAWADKYNPDILWLHNIHGYYINYELLFEWIKSRPRMQVKWTLHDCWAFTGHCAYYTYAKCDKWQNGCAKCPQISQYPASLIDCSKNNYNRKKAAFTGVSNMTIITPSNWLKEEVTRSFLAEYSVEVNYNSINREIFRSTPGSFKEDHGIQDRKMILGVASIWEKRKGLDDFIELSKLLDETMITSNSSDTSSCRYSDEYQIVLVGLSDQQIEDIHDRNINIIALPRTSSGKELAEIYTAADVFVNPTHEDNLPTVNMEAEACGTRVITYDTGGSSETIHMAESVAIKHSPQEIIKYL